MTNVARKSIGRTFRLATLVVLGASAVAAPIRAQEQGSTKYQDVNNKRVTLTLENADIRFALKLLFQAAGVNYTIDQSVQGSVTVNLTDVPFRVALESTLKNSAFPLTYRVEGGVYSVQPRIIEEAKTATADDAKEPDTPKQRTVKLHVNFADASDIATALGGSIISTRFASLGMGGGRGGFGGGGGGLRRAPND